CGVAARATCVAAAAPLRTEIVNSRRDSIDTSIVANVDGTVSLGSSLRATRIPTVVVERGVERIAAVVEVDELRT
ncbi:MAG TPA: hypothetical protein VE714_04200, partial [Gemmatimonadales bacterium]|nr:hypothetical protein [Gemmatimonadales bacterium]